MCYHHFGRATKPYTLLGDNDEARVPGCDGLDFSRTDWCVVVPEEFDDGGREYRRLTTRSSSNGGYQFKVMQIADIHLGQYPYSELGSQQDMDTHEAIKSYLEYETDIDYIILTGDQIHGEHVNKNASTYYEVIGEWIDGYGVPWGAIFGNHDNAGFQGPESTERVPPMLTRRQLVEVMHQFPNSVTHVGPPDVFGTSNYLLDVYFQDTDTIVAGMLQLDTGGGWYLPQRVDPSQLKWIDEILSPTNGVPIGAFEHIPATEREWSSETPSNVCTGSVLDIVVPVYFDAGLVTTLTNAGNVQWISVGHDHGMNTCCQLDDTDVHTCFGGHAGYGGCKLHFDPY